jgi:hypothetical protein
VSLLSLELTQLQLPASTWPAMPETAVAHTISSVWMLLSVNYQLGCCGWTSDVEDIDDIVASACVFSFVYITLIQYLHALYHTLHFPF